MISNVKFNELAGRVEQLVGKVEELENRIKALTDSQGGEIPPGMSPVSTLAAEFGISTKKAEELAKNTGVLLVKHKGGGYLAHDEKFREAARLILRKATRRRGSAYWFHPLIGKFQMSGDPEMKNAPNLKHLPKDKFVEAVILPALMHGVMPDNGKRD